MIRPALASDTPAIARIYNHYIENTFVTFEEETINADIIFERMADVQAADLPWIVAEYEGELVGYAYANKYHKRSAYRHTAETTVYLKHDFIGRGFGKLLYEVLLQSLREKGYHCAIGTLAIPNEKSIALHEKLGFTQVSHFKEIGFKFNAWRDVGHWQLIL